MLEVGYGAGLVLYNLAALHPELYGLDLDADPIDVAKRLKTLGVDANLTQGSVLDMRDVYPDAFFDVAVCFSVFEHLEDPGRALDELDRVVRPGGRIVIGMPAVNRFMEHAFQAIGFKNIEDHHITPPIRVKRIVEGQSERWTMSRRSLPGGLSPAMALYTTFLLRKAEHS
jgi:2-polyprenyl-3-methyl-5-hydroxy-6-metoxy-1,4-benzoquinol methylase